MAIKPADLLNQLPSVSELLEKPPIRSLTDRWNRSTVAGGVRSFLDDMRRELRRRAGDAPLPSLRELAERAARYVVAQRELSLGTAINATGRLRGLPWSSLPLADAALERMVAAGREFVLEKSPADGSPPIDFEPLLCRHSGGEAALAVHSYAGALWLALNAVAADREVLVARAEVGDVELAEPLPKLAASANATLKEVGTINRATAADYEALASPSTAAVIRITPDAYRVVGETATANVDELKALCREREMIFIDVLGPSSIVDNPDMGPLRSVHSSLAAGVDLAVVRGDGLVGGPACGILVGRREIIRRIAEHTLFAAWRLDVLRSAALVATLESYDIQPNALQDLPVGQLVATSVENLRNRAERMAPQLAQAEGIASATVIETRSPLLTMLHDGYPSFGVALSAPDGDIEMLDQRLRMAPRPVFGRLEGDRLVLDLRTVLARQDAMLVEVVLGTPIGGEVAEPQGVDHP